LSFIWVIGKSAAGLKLPAAALWQCFDRGLAVAKPGKERRGAVGQREHPRDAGACGDSLDMADELFAISPALVRLLDVETCHFRAVLRGIGMKRHAGDHVVVDGHHVEIADARLDVLVGALHEFGAAHRTADHP
jgi:hypothetical protein